MENDRHDDLVRRSFARQVPLFSGPDSPFAARPAGTLAWIEPLRPDMVVLDVACGAAHASEPVAPCVRLVAGVDITRALLAVAAQRLRDSGVDNVALNEGDAAALPFADETFDVVFCRVSLHHFSRPERAVSEMVRVCRRGGRVVLLDVVAPSDEVRDLYDEVHRLLDPSHGRAYLERELPDLLPGGISALTYADTSTIRLPVDILFTEVSDRDAVLTHLQSDFAGGPVTGFEPAIEDGKLAVSFATCVLHWERK